MQENEYTAQENSLKARHLAAAFLPVSGDLINHNAKAKVFPNAGVVKATYCSRSIFHESGWELHGETAKTEKPQNPDSEPRDDNVRRAKMRVFEYAMLNGFKWFITWTLDKEKIDRYDVKEVAKKLKKFLNNKVQRNNARYLIIPELHKDGAVHMHGLLSGDFKMVNSRNKTKSGQTIYNMPDWKYGYSTAIELYGDYERVSHYVTKYITKDCRKVFGDFYYAGGHGLVRQPEIHLFDALFDELDAKEYRCDVTDTRFKYQTIRMERIDSDGNIGR